MSADMPKPQRLLLLGAEVNLNGDPDEYRTRCHLGAVASAILRVFGVHLGGGSAT